MIAELTILSNVVLSTGGGAVLRIGRAGCLALEAAVFQIDRKDFILDTNGQYGNANAANIGRYENIGGARSRGFELGLHGVATDRLNWDLTYTYLDARYDEAFATRIYNPATGEGSLAVEFVGTSVTSPAFDDPLGETAAYLRSQNPHFKYIDFNKRGYMLLDVTHQRVVCEWWHLNTVSAPDAGQSLAVAYQVLDGDQHLDIIVGVKSKKDDQPFLAMAAYGDGTLRWHRMSDGQELLALYAHAESRANDCRARGSVGKSAAAATCSTASCCCPAAPGSSRRSPRWCSA